MPRGPPHTSLRAATRKPSGLEPREPEARQWRRTYPRWRVLLWSCSCANLHDANAHEPRLVHAVLRASVLAGVPEEREHKVGQKVLQHELVAPGTSGLSVLFPICGIPDNRENVCPLLGHAVSTAPVAAVRHNEGFVLVLQLLQQTADDDVEEPFV